jgi:hypothetical protein
MQLTDILQQMGGLQSIARDPGVSEQHDGESAEPRLIPAPAEGATSRSLALALEVDARAAPGVVAARDGPRRQAGPKRGSTQTQGH